MKLTPTHRLYGLGGVLLASLTVCAQYFSRRGEPAFVAWLLIAGVAYLLAFRELYVAPELPRRVILFGLAVSCIWHIEFLPRPPGIDDDIHRYLWDGRVQRLGYNPYLLVPNDPAVARLHTPETVTLNNPEVPSPYPPGAQLFFRAVTAVHESALSLKVAFVLCDAAIAFLLLGILRRTGQREHWVLAYAWQPLLAIEVAGSGHVDIVGALLLVFSAAALLRRWTAIAAISFAFAVAVKFIPIVLLPLFWRRIRIRDGLLFGVVLGALYMPFLNHGRIPFGSLGAYVQRFRFNDPVFATLERVTTPQLAAGLALLAGLITAMWMRSRSKGWAPDEFAWPMAASFLCAPVVYPWYLLWLAPFVRSIGTFPIVIWSVSIVPTYYVWYLRGLGRQWAVPGWIMLLEYGAIVSAAAFVLLQRIRRSTAVQCAAGEGRE